MLGASELVAFVPVTDLGRARAFYEGVLGLPCVDQDGFACVFDANGTTLRVTLVENFKPAGFTVLGWAVDDVAAALTGLAGPVDTLLFPGLDQDGAGIWTTPDGIRVVWFKDPDGNVLSLTQVGGS